MAQENANICHAAIAFKNDFNATNTGQRLEVVAATGIDLASVKRRTDVEDVAIVYEFDLVEAIADDDLIILTGLGPIKPNSEGSAPGGVPVPTTVPIQVQRAIGDTTQRRFWVLLLVTDLNCAVQFNRIAPLDAPFVLVDDPP